MTPMRDQITKKLITQFLSNMRDGSLSLVPLEEQVLAGQDDWGDDEESRVVECWWAVFGRQQQQQ